MYLEHFGLEQPPFRITPDTRVFYPGGERGAVLEALAWAVENGEGIVKVVGEVGSGKTMLSRMLANRLPAHVDLVYLVNPGLGPDDVLPAIAFELGLKVKPGRQLATQHRLHEDLVRRHAEGRQVVVFIEEAQNMPLETLETLRLLSNLETDDSKLLQIVLFGQPELDEKLESNEIRQLRERITHSFDLRPFAGRDASDYLNFRLRAAGYRGPELFPAAIARRLNHYAEGLIRRLNVLADKTLLAAYADGTHTINQRHVRRAAQDRGELGRSPRRFAWGLSLALVLLLVGVAMVWIVLANPGLAGLAGLPTGHPVDAGPEGAANSAGADGPGAGTAREEKQDGVGGEMQMPALLEQQRQAAIGQPAMDDGPAMQQQARLNHPAMRSAPQRQPAAPNLHPAMRAAREPVRQIAAQDTAFRGANAGVTTMATMPGGE